MMSRAAFVIIDGRLTLVNYHVPESYAAYVKYESVRRFICEQHRCHHDD